VNIRATTKLNAKQIAAMVNHSVSSVEHIIGIYFRNGLEGLTAKKREGNRRNLSHTQEKELLSSFEEKAKNGYMLTISEIQEEYCKYVEHKVAVSTIYRMLARHGWRKIMPRSKHPKKASDQAIEAYKKGLNVCPITTIIIPSPFKISISFLSIFPSIFYINIQYIIT
jgi:transposase